MIVAIILTHEFHVSFSCGDNSDNDNDTHSMSSVLVSGKVWLASISKIELTKTLGLKMIILFVQIKHKSKKLLI